MTRLSRTFAELGKRNEAALICFLTAGDPDMEMTERLVIALDQAGADGVELGIPFSDPLADGKTIQAASERALAHHVTIDTVLAAVKRLRRATDIPIVLMTYCNPVMQYGEERFAERCHACGVDGVIITDLPPEEGNRWIAAARRENVDTIFLLAPTSTEERINKVTERTTGFIYCVSRTGVTGVQQTLPPDLQALVRRIRSKTNKPIGVGFGISRPEHVHALVCEAGADAVIVGSALINIIQAALQEGRDPLAVASRKVAQLKKATKKVG